MACFKLFLNDVDALLIIGLPNGPTAHFKLSKLVLRKDIKVCHQKHILSFFFYIVECDK